MPCGTLVLEFLGVFSQLKDVVFARKRRSGYEAAHHFGLLSRLAKFYVAWEPHRS